MELIAEIYDSTLGLKPSKVEKWTLRRAARSVVLNSKGEVILFHSRKFDYYKIPGGGIEGPESIEGAAIREAREETGYKIRIDKPLGAIIEYRSRIHRILISYCFLARTIGNPGPTNLDKGERAERFIPITAKDLDHAIRLTRQKKGRLPYLAKFMTARELLFLKKAKESVS